MRKVKVTKQQTVNPKAVYMGLSISQLIGVGIGIGIALLTLYFLFFKLSLNVNIVMSIIFIELLISCGIAIIRVNGLNLFQYIIMCLKKPDYRPYLSKGMMNEYEIHTEEEK